MKALLKVVKRDFDFKADPRKAASSPSKRQQ